MKTRKWLAILLCMAMVCAMLYIPAGATDGAAVPAEAVTEQPKASLEQSFSAEKERQQNAKTLSEVAVDDSVTLFAADTATLSGTIKLPSGVSAPEKGRIGVYLYALEKDGNKVLKAAGSTTASTTVEIAKGASSASYSITAPKGSYGLGVRYYSNNSEVLSEVAYYCNDGTSWCLEGADPINLTSSKTVNVTLPRAERSISGTITLKEPAAKDGYAYVDCYSDGAFYVYSYISVPVTAGQKTVDYTIGVRKAVYSLEVSVGSGAYAYYSVYGDFNANWDDSCYLNTESASLSGIDGVYDNTAEENSVDVTVQLSKAATEKTRYAVVRHAGTNNWSYYSVDVNAGADSFSRTVTTSGRFLLSVSEVADYYSSYTPTYYYSETLGLTSDVSQATWLDGSVKELTLTFPSATALTGTVQRNGCRPDKELDLFVFAKVGTERFYDIVTIAADADSAAYSIDIPNRFSGQEATVYASLRSFHSSRELSVSGESVTTSSYQNVTVSAPDDAYQTISGTVTLPAPAPAGGVLLEFNTRGNGDFTFTSASYFVPEGETSISYTADTLCIPSNKAESGAYQIRLNASSPDSRFCAPWVTLTANAETNVCNYTLATLSQTVSGSVLAPEGMALPSGISYEVSGNYQLGNSSYYIYQYGSILKGQNKSDYTLRVPAGATLTNLELYFHSTGTSPIFATSLYYDGTGSTEDWTNISIPLTNGLKNANFQLIRGKVIQGVINVPDDFVGDAYASVETWDSYSGSRIRITGGGEYPYAATTRYDTTETELWLYLDEESPCNYYTGATYYTAEGSSYLGGDLITLDEDVVSGYDFELMKGKKISGTLSFDEDAYINGTTVSAEVYAYGAGLGDFENSYNLRLQSTADSTYSVSIPADYEGEVGIYVYVYPYNTAYTNIARGNYYYTTDGSLSLDDSQAMTSAVGAAGATVNLTIPAGYKVSGKVILPENATGDKIETAYIHFTPDGGGSSFGNTVTLGADGSYSLYVPPTPTAYYAYASPNVPANSNILTDSVYYVSSSASSTNYSDRTVFTVSGDTADINFLPLANSNVISGKITAPAGVTVPAGASAYLSLQSGSSSSYKRITLTGNETPFVLALPINNTGNLRLSYNVSNAGSSFYSETVYLGADGPVLSGGNAKALTEADYTGLTVPLVKRLGTVELTATRPIYASPYSYLSADVYAIFDNDSVLDSYISIYYEETSSRSILEIPDLTEIADATSFKLYYDVYTSDGDLKYRYNEMYINGDGSFTFDESAAKAFAPNKTHQVKFTIWDNSALAANAVKEGLVTSTVSEAYVDADEGVACVTLNVKNSDENIDTYYATVLVGEYDAKGVLVGVSRQMYTIEGEDELYLELPVETGDGHTYKLFSWDNMGIMTPLAEAMNMSVR